MFYEGVMHEVMLVISLTTFLGVTFSKKSFLLYLCCFQDFDPDLNIQSTVLTNINFHYCFTDLGKELKHYEVFL